MERTLLSYERVGWAEEPAVTTEGTEIRPAAECGPIILCLDTSGSMMGARETVAKAGPLGRGGGGGAGGGGGGGVGVGCTLRALSCNTRLTFFSFFFF